MKIFSGAKRPTPVFPHLDKPHLLHPTNVDKLDTYQWEILQARVQTWLRNPTIVSQSSAINLANAAALYHGTPGVILLAKVMQQSCVLAKNDDEPYESTLVQAVMLYQFALKLLENEPNSDELIQEITTSLNQCKELIPATITEIAFNQQVDDHLSIYQPNNAPTSNQSE